MQPNVQPFFDPATSTASFLVWDPATNQAAVIDPVLDFDAKAARISTRSLDAILAFTKAKSLQIRYVLETHAHADHLSAADRIRRQTGAEVVIGAAIVEVQKTFIPRFEADDVVPNGAAFDRLVAEGEVLPLGELAIKVMATPGHTAACVTYRIGDSAFVGDTLFMPDYGTARTDFPGGNAATLFRSIRKILSLPPETRLFVGHDYLPDGGRKENRWETTVAEQRAKNVHIHDGVSEAEFVALRKTRDATLAPPALILPSLQVNIRAGALPPASPAGNVFLRLPVSFA